MSTDTLVRLAVIRPLSATPVVAVAALLLVAAVMTVLLASFVLYRRSGRR